jgi:hypothetical protein
LAKTRFIQKIEADLIVLSEIVAATCSDGLLTEDNVGSIAGGPTC